MVPAEPSRAWEAVTVMHASRVTVAEALGGYQFRLAEGPVWDAERGSLIVVDLWDNRFIELTLNARVIRSFATESTVGCVGLRAGGGYVVATAESILILREDLQVEHRLPGAGGGKRFNDGKVSPQGDFWVGKLAIDENPGEGSIALLSASDLSQRTLVGGLTLPNGLDWFGDSFLHVDSLARTVSRYSWGQLHLGTGGVMHVEQSGALPDGLCIDSEGGVWIAFWDGGEVRRFDPSAAITDIVRVPVSRPSSCALVGDDLSTLLVTTCMLPENSAPAGGLFATRVKIPGSLPHRFAG